jgi:hypothetical protein
MVGGRAVRFDRWEEEFMDVAGLVSSTSAPHFLMTVAKLEPIMHGTAAAAGVYHRPGDAPRRRTGGARTGWGVPVRPGLA